MPRILICTVGGEAQPIVNAVEQNQRNAPLDRVYFLCSAGTGPGASDVTIEQATTRQISHRCRYCKRESVKTVQNRPIAETARLDIDEYAIERFSNPDDLIEILQACGRIEADIASRWPRQQAEVLANYTGGTKTMSLGLALAALRKKWAPAAQHHWTGTPQPHPHRGGRPGFAPGRLGPHRTGSAGKRPAAL